MQPRIAIYALTRRGAALGAALAERLSPLVRAELHTASGLELPGEHPFDSLLPRVRERFHHCDGHIFITAAGIAVRAIAPLIRSKGSDPAVVVMDQDGKHVISLLAGHLGGANELARQVADLCGGTPIITTATDTANLPSLDLMAKERGLVLGNLEGVAKANSALLAGRAVQVYDPENALGVAENDLFHPVSSPGTWKHDAPGVWVDWKNTAPGNSELRLFPRRIWAGIGCRKGVPAWEIRTHLLTVITEADIAPQALAGIATIEEKRQEPGITATAKELGIPLRYFTREQLNAVDGTTPSELVRQHMGTGSVCEAAALLASQGSLLVSKQKTERVTCALAISSS